jgi:hypothetical protein
VGAWRLEVIIRMEEKTGAIYSAEIDIVLSHISYFHMQSKLSHN